jgi:hypothetical protein
MVVIVVYLKNTNSFAIYKSLEFLKSSYIYVNDLEFQEFIKDFSLHTIENKRWRISYDFVLG